MTNEESEAPAPESVLIRQVGQMYYDGVPIGPPIVAQSLLTNVIDGEVVGDRPALPPAPDD